MKKIYFLVTSFVLMANFSFAQWTTSGSNIYYNTGAVGIGTATPTQTLDVWGTGLLFHSTSGNQSEILLRDGSIEDPKIAADNGGIVMNYFGYNGGTTYYRDLTIFNGKSGLIAQFNGATGDVGIGTTNTDGYMLAVAGSAIATSFTVKAVANWPDYVFKPSYKLIPLSELKGYIAKNNHLPDFPSAADIATKGLNLGETDKLLTKKVEELTLYLIDKDKQLNDEKEINDKQQRQLDTQSEQLKAQQEQLDQLKTQLSSLLKQQKN